MKLTIVYDNKIYKKGIGLKSDWGFSCLIETKNSTILFDTGARGPILLNNLNKLHLDPNIIDKIIISHEHWDHTGGLNSLAFILRDIDLYRISEEKPNENIQLISVYEPGKITDKIFTTGRLKGPIDEQSLILNGESGWFVLTGCSHPGIKKILDTAKKHGKISGLIGGFHGFDYFSILQELDFICPCHCTKHSQTIKKIFPESYNKCGVGRIIEI